MLRSKSSRRSVATGRQRKLRPIEKCQFVVLPQFQDANGGKLNLGTGGPALNAQQGSSTGADTNDPLYVGERGLRLPGATGNYASTPDAAPLDITGDIAIGAYIEPDDYTPSATGGIVAKWTATGDQRSYELILNTAGTLGVGYSTNGTGAGSSFDNSSVALSEVPQWVAATLDVSETTNSFWTSTDPHDTPLADITWTEWGAANTSMPASLHSGSGVLEVGTNGAGTGQPFAGRIDRAFVISGGLTDAAAFDADFTKVDGGATSFTEDSSNAATVTINQSGVNPARIIDGPTDILHTDDYFEIPDNDEMDVAADESFVAAFAGRTYDVQPTAVEVFIGKKNNIGTDAGWMIYNQTSADYAVPRLGDGSVNPFDATPDLVVGQNHVVVMRRDVAADEIEGGLDGVMSGSPATDTTTASLANSSAMRIGADGDTAALFADVEHHGAAFRNCHDGPAPNDREVEVLSRQLAAATGRSF